MPTSETGPFEVKHQDKCSLANSLDIAAHHIDLDWHVNFERQIIAGTTTIFLSPNSTAAIERQPEKKITQVRLDAKNLDVCLSTSIEVGMVPKSWDFHEKVVKQPFKKHVFSMPFSAPRSRYILHDDLHSKEKIAAMGNGIEIDLPEECHCTSTDDIIAVKIRYTTVADERCLALCWLSASQTKNGQQPFMYSQCQAIHARTLLPCQDSPGVRTTYTASVTCKEGCIPLMSALPVGEGSGTSNTAVFHQPVPIASYLIAIVCGQLGKHVISDRCAVYAELDMVEKSGEEFSEMEEFLKVAEKIAGPYRWTRYDLVVLPPSFPFGGMENPNLTFVTPSLIVGDKSLVEVVAHEICHSWSGNLVGCATWEEFFLNEGFTVLIQRKMTHVMQGPAMQGFESITGWHHLEQSVAAFADALPYTAMRPALDGVDPDDAFSTVPYEKGCTFLQALEEVVGVDAFDAWLPTYFNDFAYKSISGDDMREHFLAHFADKEEEINKAIAWDKFYKEEGMPSYKPTFDTTARDECSKLAQTFADLDNKIVAANDEAAKKTAVDHFSASFEFPKSWGGQQHVAFFEELMQFCNKTKKSGLEDATLCALNDKFNIQSSVDNNEILCVWYQLCLLSEASLKAKGSKVSVEYLTNPNRSLLTFLQNIGRMKFVRTLFAAWAVVDLEAARAHFAICEPKYHSIALKMLAKDLKLNEQ